MERISDSVLVGEIRRRLDENKRALSDLRNVTKKLEDVNYRLKESESLKSNFLSNIRNEIVNPLTSIIGLSSQMSLGDLDADEYPRLAGYIFNEAFELDFQLRNIFMAAELEAGDALLSVARIDIPQFIGRVVGTFSNAATLKDVSVSIRCNKKSCSGEKAMFWTDPEKLQLVLANLLANAIEYSPKGGNVTVKGWKEKNNLCISVIDKGSGIKQSRQKDIFDRFRQLSSGLSKEHKGHGLGLSIVKSILSLMDGSVVVSSVVGKGATFTVTIPESPFDESDDIFSEDGNEFIFDESVSGAEVEEF